MASSKTRRKTTTAASTRISSKDNRAGSRPKAVPDGQANRVKQSSITGRGAKPGSKQAVLVERLCRPSGAGIGDLVKTLGWLPHTVRAAVTGVRKKGFVVTCSKDAQGQSVYRATPPATETAKSKSSAKAASTGAA